MLDLSSIELSRDIPFTMSGLYERVWRNYVRFLDGHYEIGEAENPLYVQLLEVAILNDVIEEEVEIGVASRPWPKEVLCVIVTQWVVAWATKVEDAIYALRKAHFPDALSVYISSNANPLPNQTKTDVHVSATAVRITVPVDDMHYLRVDVDLTQ